VRELAPFTKSSNIHAVKVEWSLRHRPAASEGARRGSSTTQWGSHASQEPGCYPLGDNAMLAIQLGLDILRRELVLHKLVEVYCIHFFMYNDFKKLSLIYGAVGSTIPGGSHEYISEMAKQFEINGEARLVPGDRSIDISHTDPNAPG